MGNRGGSLFRTFMPLPECQVVAAADCYENRRNQVAAICKGKAYADFRELLARDDIDAVVIATPDHWHVPIGIAAAQAKKDVYIEKPLGVTIEQDLAMQKVIADQQRVFQYGTQQRSMPHCWTGCELVRRGAIGKRTHHRSRCAQWRERWLHSAGPDSAGFRLRYVVWASPAA